MGIQKLNKRQRAENITKLIKEIGLGNISQTGLAKEWGVSRQTIIKDIRDIVKNYNFTDLNGAKIKLFTAMEKALHSAHLSLKQATNEKEKSMARKDIALLTKEFVNLLESFGIKEKIADKLETTSIQIGLSSEQLKKWYENWKQKQLNT